MSPLGFVFCNFFLFSSCFCAINANKLLVTFNQKVDEDSATEISNYYLGLTEALTKSISTDFEAVIQEGGKSVVIQPKDVLASTGKGIFNPKDVTFVAGQYLVKNGEKATLEVRNVRNADGKLMSTQAYEFSAVDTVRPALEETSIEAKPGDTTLQIPLTEGVIVTAGTKVYVDGVEITGAGNIVTATTTGTQTVSEASTLVLTVPALTAGNKEVSIVGLADFNGNLISPNPSKVTVKVATPETTAPSVLKIEQVKDDTIRIFFDKEVAAGATVLMKDLTGAGSNATFTLGAVSQTVVNKQKLYFTDVDFVDVTPTTGTATTKANVYGDAHQIIRTVEVSGHKNAAGDVGKKHTESELLKLDTWIRPKNRGLKSMNN